MPAGTVSTPGRAERHWQPGLWVKVRGEVECGSQTIRIEQSIPVDRALVRPPRYTWQIPHHYLHGGFPRLLPFPWDTLELPAFTVQDQSIQGLVVLEQVGLCHKVGVGHDDKAVSWQRDGQALDSAMDG